MFGWKVANVPLVNGIDPPPELFQVSTKRVFGLSISARNLITQRHKRLQQMGNIENVIYTDERKVREELRYANFIFEKGGFSIVNVNNKPIETSANEIIGIISDRFGYEDRKLRDAEQ
jgi:regulator of PEP synthase PpsR (kinase-PPPase family)